MLMVQSWCYNINGHSIVMYIVPTHLVSIQSHPLNEFNGLLLVCATIIKIRAMEHYGMKYLSQVPTNTNV